MRKTIITTLPVRSRLPLMERIIVGILLIAVSGALGACKKIETPKPVQVSHVSIETLSSFDVCNGDDCVYKSEALRDLYQVQDTSANIAILPNLAIVSIIGSIKYSDVSDLYAVFIAQALQIQEGKISTCHACTPILGLVIYQYHNGWKLFARNATVKYFGAWGTISLATKDIELVSRGTEKFIISLKSSSGGQGFTTETVDLISVDPNNKLVSPPIRPIGLVVTAEEDCHNSAGQGEDWTGDVKYDLSTDPPIIGVIKKYRKNCTNEFVPTHRETLSYQYDWHDGNYKIVGK